MNKKFICPKCGEKIPFRELFNFKRNYVTECCKCHAKLKPKNIKTWNYGFTLVFLGVVIPGYSIIHFLNNYLLAFLVGIITGILAILGIAIYTYLTVDFIEID